MRQGGPLLRRQRGLGGFYLQNILCLLNVLCSKEKGIKGRVAPGGPQGSPGATCSERAPRDPGEGVMGYDEWNYTYIYIIYII